MDLILIDEKHPNHPPIPDLCWAPQFRCAANPDSAGLPPEWAHTQNQTIKFCQKAAQYWKQHRSAKRWLNPFALLSMCYRQDYGSMDKDNQWIPDTGAIVRGCTNRKYDPEQPLALMARVIGCLRRVHGIELDGMYVDAEDGPDASNPKYAEAFSIWHHATGGTEQQFWQAGKDAQWATAGEILDTLGCQNAKLCVIECNSSLCSSKHWWTPEEIPSGVTGAFCNANEIRADTDPTTLGKQINLARSKQCPSMFLYAPSVTDSQLGTILTAALAVRGT